MPAPLAIPRHATRLACCRFLSVAPRVVRRLALLVAIVGCDRPAPAVGDRTTAVISAPREDSVAVVTEADASGFDVEAGPVLVLPDAQEATTGALLRIQASNATIGDTTGLGAAIAEAPFELFSRSGRVERARLRVERPPPVEPGCTAWPVARLTFDGAAPPAPWTVAFLADRIEPIALDSIEGLPPRDSAQLAADLSRIASSLPDDTSATFRIRPYVVLRAWRSRGVEPALVIALLIRRVNQEDAPREERLVMVLDPVAPTTGASAPPRGAAAWRVGWHERAEGVEDELVVAEPLLAYRVRGKPEAHLLFARDDGFALSATVLVRQPIGWRIRWESAIPGCG